MTALGNLLRQIADIVDANGGEIPPGILNVPAKPAAKEVPIAKPVKELKKENEQGYYKEHIQKLLRAKFY
jgi:hypothetical protein